MDNINAKAVSNAMAAAKSVLSPAEMAKIEALFKNKAAIEKLSSGMSKKDLDTVTAIMNNPALLKQILSSPKGKEGLNKFLGL